MNFSQHKIPKWKWGNCSPAKGLYAARYSKPQLGKTFYLGVVNLFVRNEARISLLTSKYLQEKTAIKIQLIGEPDIDAIIMYF
jgi:hypothetical protein